MLTSLYVKDFAIVGEADITLVAGLTVVTGETGAGKSLLVDALLLLSGGRAEAGVVRHGSERAELAAEFDLSSQPDIRAWLQGEELDEDQSCQLRRVIRADGGSRSYINGRPVTLTQLKALGERLIEIHGQHEHQALLERSSQLALLDAFGGHAQTLAQVNDLARRWREVTAQIAQLGGNEDHAERIEMLEHQVGELQRDALSASELDALNERHRQLANAGQLVQGCANVAELLDGESEFALLRALARGQNETARLALLDTRLIPVSEMIDAAQIQLVEANAELARYRDALDLDPERLSELDTQIGRLHELARKYRTPMANLKQRENELRNELDSLQGAGERLQQLGRERTLIEHEYTDAAALLSKARAQAAVTLGARVSELIAELGMGGGRLEIMLEPSAKSTPETNGRERAEFLVSANPGQPPRALRKVASGGELSRISLAIEVAALGLDEVGTMVFDEVDSGIGGAVAEVVGQKLRRLGSQRQVLCVTHLAQVAAQGHQHFCVSKVSDGQSTQTRIDALDEKSRRDEIARMLGGIDITRETLAHAKQMLTRAQAN
ncbi:DNA repair protein RecN [Pseudolysobacter antarcticus]|uniref:DNA repair protein RecN n=1 Tax=Pseudolysobacter antarcticus TaxID=2511995 RepID=A0A411HJD3_9GAMM|nr:DNA repair protein RecN [Pseudolysobacter antarcticus]QBB70497.1 DNA repair protein RecN [Pseudolysobacter antarcticus]